MTPAVADDTVASGVRDKQKSVKDEAQLETSGNGQTELMDVDDDSKAHSNAQQITPRPSQAQTPVPTQPSGFSIDVCFEASKLPLDIAIFNSVRATGGEEKIRKYLQAVLVVGGTALTQGVVHALESRYGIHFLASSSDYPPLMQASSHCCTAGFQHGEGTDYTSAQGGRSSCTCMEGSCSLGKDGQHLGTLGYAIRLGEQRSRSTLASGSWKFQDILGMRGLKERCFYL